MSFNEETYAILKQDMLCIYNTQICGVIIEMDYPYKGYPASYSYFKRNKLEHKLRSAKNFPYVLLRFLTRLISFSIIIGGILWLSYLCQDTLLAIMLGYLGAQLCTVAYMVIGMAIEYDFEYERFSKFKK